MVPAPARSFTGVLLPGLYNGVTPALAGPPCLYRYRPLRVVIAGVLTGVVHLVMR